MNQLQSYSFFSSCATGCAWGLLFPAYKNSRECVTRKHTRDDVIFRSCFNALALQFVNKIALRSLTLFFAL